MPHTTCAPDHEAFAPARRSHPRVAAVLVPLTAAALLLAPAPALAHDVLTSSSPEDGDTLDTVPEEIVLSFNNPPMEGGSGSAVVVTGPDGETTYEGGVPVFDDLDVSVALNPLDEAGEYTVAFRVVSSDGHPIQDSLVFTVTDEAIAAAAPEPEEEAPADPAEEADEAETDSEEAAAERAPAEESDEGALSPVAIAVVAAVALCGIAAVVLVAARLRNRHGTGAGGSSDRS